MIQRTDERLLTFGLTVCLNVSHVQLTIPGCPYSQNQCYRIVTLKLRGQEPHSSLTMTREGHDYLAAIRVAALRVRPPRWDLGRNVDVEAVYYFDNLRPDVDGPGKLILDALGADHPRKGPDGKRRQLFPEGVLVRNDRQVRDFLQRRRLDRERPRLELLVVSIPPAQGAFPCQTS